MAEQRVQGMWISYESENRFAKNRGRERERIHLFLFFLPFQSFFALFNYLGYPTSFPLALPPSLPDLFRLSLMWTIHLNNVVTSSQINTGHPFPFWLRIRENVCLLVRGRRRGTFESKILFHMNTIYTHL